MTLLIGFLTFILVLNCLFLILLILIQLPKKEAGAGVAFGGAATDALFGAGSGNALTRLTKYTATFFVMLSIVLSVLNMNAARQGSQRIEQELSRQANVPGAVTPPAASPQVAPVPATGITVQPLPLPTSTNLMSAPTGASLPSTVVSPGVQAPANVEEPASTPAPAPVQPDPQPQP